MASPRIALLGLGIMGGGMARRLLGAGFPLTVFNRSRARAEPLGAAGARIAATPREAAADADIVIGMVADDNASRALWLGPDGALAALPPGALAVECSTLTVGWIGELARAVAARGNELVDAPVTGSKPAAAAGELTFLAGGTAAAVARLQPAFAAMGRATVHLGPVGSGALMKLVNNFVSAAQVTAFAEAVAFIERSPLDRTQAVQVLVDGAPGSPIVKTMAARMLPPDFAPNFYLRLMAKDLGYAVDEAAKRGLVLEMGSAAWRQFQRGIAAGHGDQDMAAVVEPMRR
jgi:3-hydroxyisobutyrate dehydrogenase